MIVDSRGYEEIIDGTKTPPGEKEVIDISDKDGPDMKRVKKEKLAARMANKGLQRSGDVYRGISLNIVENTTSDKLSKGDLRKGWGRLERRWNPK